MYPKCPTSAPTRATCRGCPLRAECLEWGLGVGYSESRRDPLLGGLTDDERRIRRALERGYLDVYCPVCGWKTRAEAPLRPECRARWAERRPACLLCLAKTPPRRSRCDECLAFLKRLNSFRERGGRMAGAHVPGTCFRCGVTTAEDVRYCTDCTDQAQPPLTEYRVTPEFYNLTNGPDADRLD